MAGSDGVRGSHPPTSRRCVGPDFLIALYQNGAKESLLTELAGQMSMELILQSLQQGKITMEDTKFILALKENSEPWPVRVIKWLFL